MRFHDDWSDDEKINDLTELQPMYILIHDSSDAFVGFCCYQIDFNDKACTDLVVYLYELQVAGVGRGKGIGSALMAHVESIAISRGIRVVLCSVADLLRC
jgi:ribosomal protein S18 acetylase RimI-like enzyme